ncbi:MAG: transketolase, partial [Hungatella sp.]
MNMDTMSVNAIRVLAADAIQKANSGHPGLPLGSAPMAYELWANHMNHNPADPQWENRDRFVLSGGHGSMLLYSLLHLFGYGDLSKEDLMNFRQMGSLTPGHPEYRHTVGVEATTGPLGAGMGMAVGMAMAETHLAAVFNKEDYPIVDHYTYVLGGDGCMMEGISSEAFSLAGTLGLGKLIVFYDSNSISIEGSTDLAFTEDVEKRMDAFGFQTLTVEDGNDLTAIGEAIEQAKADLSRPSFITVKTQIGYGCPAKQGKASAHGEPLGAENIKAMKEYLEWPSQEPFYVPEEVYANYRRIAEQKEEVEAAWKVMFAAYCEEFPDMEAMWDQYHDTKAAEALLEDEAFWAQSEKPEATRNLSGKAINYLKDKLPNLFGGSADLAPSNKTNMQGVGDFSKATPEGRNLHFGVRELSMTAIGNGIMLHGGLRAYVATFFVFSDYVKPMARLSALMGVPLTFVLTHDSIGVGEDGPTHEPIEQLAMLRAMPNFHVFRPCDAVETAAAWYSAMTSAQTPTALVLTRQNLAPMAGSSKEALKGGYVIEDCQGTPEVILIASGSEVELAGKAKAELEKEGRRIRIVSMPCMDLFEEQSDEYK